MPWQIRRQKDSCKFNQSIERRKGEKDVFKDS